MRYDNPKEARPHARLSGKALAGDRFGNLLSVVSGCVPLSYDAFDGSILAPPAGH